MRRRSPVKRKERRVPYAMGKVYAKGPGGNGTWQVKGSPCSKGQRLRHTPNIQKDGASYGLEQDWSSDFHMIAPELHFLSPAFQEFRSIPLHTHSSLFWFMEFQWEGKRHPVRIVFIFHGMYLGLQAVAKSLGTSCKNIVKDSFLVSVKTAFFFFLMTNS